jgi:hypothetical protein
MGDERIEARPALRLEDARRGMRVERRGNALEIVIPA